MAHRPAVIICDKSRLFREGLASLLQQSKFKISAVYPDFGEMQQKLGPGAKGGLFLLGAHSADEFDMQEIADFKQAHAGCHVVLLINSCSEEQRWQAAHRGLDGVLLKSISSEVLCLSLDLVLKSQSVFIVNSDSGFDHDGAPAEIDAPQRLEGRNSNAQNSISVAVREPSGSVLDGLASLPASDATMMVSSRREGLSDRELEILDCLVNGHSNKVIARRCNITEATVKVHLKAILRKISVANRTQAAVWAINKMHRASVAGGTSGSLRLDHGSDGGRSEEGDANDTDDAHSAVSAAQDPRTVITMRAMLPGSAVPAH